MGKVTFVAMLYLMALCGLFLGGSQLFLKVQFALGAENGVMKSSDATLLRTVKFAPGSPTSADVIYDTPAGPVAVKGKALSAVHAQALANGEGLSLRFLKSDPHRVLFDGQELPLQLGWLIGGAVLLAVAVFAHRLLRREAGQG